MQSKWNRFVTSCKLVLSIATVTGAISLPARNGQAAEQPVQAGRDGRLNYVPDELGNQIPDFSSCGYAGGDRDIPDIPIRVTIQPAAGDDRDRIQAAIDYVAALPMDQQGFRGAVQLAPGQFEISGPLQWTGSGIVLCGAGAGPAGTTLLGTGTDRRALIRIAGTALEGPESVTHEVVDSYVPVGAVQMRLDSTQDLQIGDMIIILRPSTESWIERLNMQLQGTAWKPGTRNITWYRRITGIEENSITIDAPITTAIERASGGATVRTYTWDGRIENVGVEDLSLVSKAKARMDHPHDEDHAWFGITMENVQNGWIRRMEYRHFAGGAVLLRESAQRITVEDCIALAPISELGGYRRHTYFTQGQQTLFLRCWSEEGLHDFATGHCAAGPNAFVHCQAIRARGDSGPLESWGSGVLYDNVRIDGGGLHLKNRWHTPPRTGWSAANCVIWQCQAATIHCDRPPTANNWVIGFWAEPSGDGILLAGSDFVRPLSLFQAQLRDRLGNRAAARVDPLLLQPVGATNPSVREAARFVDQSDTPPRQLIDVIRTQFAAGGSQRALADPHEHPNGLPSFKQFLADRAPRDGASSEPSVPAAGQLAIKNGWLAVAGRLKTGRRLNPTWWRGSIRPSEAIQFGPSITRFAPGRIGVGLTDDLAQVAKGMVRDRVAAYDHHYGLWYDRRRDDHLMVRRADGNVAPPFYAQPFARSGKGTAWDGLSRYDLQSYNPWYWNRLRNFAWLCDQHGLVLFHQNYFQHNILEAGAHWADSPWRPVNNINQTTFPEPPPYIGDKRIFIAHLFYDTNNARHRELHRAYIRQCLDNFSDCANVVQMTSAEYTGPVEFVQFWLDVIIQWQQDRDRTALVALSCPKDVQDSILADPSRSPHIDLIDIRYWTYQASGELYAPQGGMHLAPRQHLRQLRPAPSSFASIVRAVRAYRTQYPGKVVLYNADQCCRSGCDGWAVLIGGGSLPNLPPLPVDLERAILTMQPRDGIVAGDDAWSLGRPDGDHLVYWARQPLPQDIRLADKPTQYRAIWLDSKSGAIVHEQIVHRDWIAQLQPQSNVLWLAPE